MRRVQAASILESISGYAQANFEKEREPGNRSAKIGTIDPAYEAGDPKILFDGEDDVSEKAYPFLGPYIPQPNDRVVLMPVGHSYVVLGAIVTGPPVQPGWNHIDAGVALSDFSVDLTKNGVYPAGTFSMIRVYMSPIMASGNSWLVGTVNNKTGASDYARGWWGESFDGVTAARKVANDGNRAVFGYTSGLSGSSAEVIFHRTSFASEIPMRGISNRGAPSGFDANREFMHAYSSMNADTLLSSVQFFISSGNISRAEWHATGYWSP